MATGLPRPDPSPDQPHESVRRTAPEHASAAADAPLTRRSGADDSQPTGGVEFTRQRPARQVRNSADSIAARRASGEVSGNPPEHHAGRQPTALNLPQEPDHPTENVVDAVQPPRPVRRFFEDLGASSVQAVVWHTTAIAAEALAPGMGYRAVQFTRFSAGVMDALADLNSGRGFTVPVPLVQLPLSGLHPDYTLNIRFRLFEEDPPPFPLFGPEVGWDLADIPLPEPLQVDGVERDQTRVVAVSDAATAPSTAGVYNTQALVRFAAERAVATGVIEHVSWAPLVVVYLRPYMRAGMLVVRPPAGQAYAPLWFQPAASDDDDDVH
ncbi:hypothetical protein ABZS66_59250 [Dactylosporangium sp. NPDC005572]|uniref:hypothetical protein n=1 Tax=Dactylosporangium sp. NPDC005572 TaxID=3156889 RepID=UPI00339DC7AF